MRADSAESRPEPAEPGPAEPELAGPGPGEPGEPGPEDSQQPDLGLPGPEGPGSGEPRSAVARPQGPAAPFSYTSMSDFMGDAPRVPAYQVAARMLAQGVLSGLAGAVPMVGFLLTAMALDGALPPPDLLGLVAGFLLAAAVVSAWGAALTAVEEFARRADRSLGRMVAASLGFPVFALVAAAWISGVVSGGPLGGLRMVQTLLTVLLDELQREPGASVAMTGALLAPFLGLLLIRRQEREDERKLAGSYYVKSAAVGMLSAASVLLANLLWGPRPEFGSVLLGFAAMASIVGAVALGLAAGRAISDRLVRRYERWTYAD